MSVDTLTKFPSEVKEKINYYVYRLIDPRNGETFYVGVGKDDRIFQHIQAERSLGSDSKGNKLERIRAIHLAGLQVCHVIHRHGMERVTAEAVEAALIDAYPGLTNKQMGRGSDGKGPMHVKEILNKYCAEVAEIKHKVLFINISKSCRQMPIYEAVRYAWVLDPLRAEKAQYILATVEGLIKGAFVASKWLDANAENFPGREPKPGCFGFEGKEAPEEIRNMYEFKRVPEKYRRKKGDSNPIKYTY